MLKRLRVAMVVTGFPTPANPMRGVFNYHSAKRISEFADLRILYLRTWKPGRQFVEHTDYDGIEIICISVPQIPVVNGSSRLLYSNILLYRTLGWTLISKYLNDRDLLHSVGGVSAGVIASDWCKKLGVHHITQLTGSDVNLFLAKKSFRSLLGNWETTLDGVSCNSKALEQSFIMLYPEVHNVRTVYRGVDVSRFEPGMRSTRTVNGDGVRFLYLGGFFDYRESRHRKNYKGGETLLKAWSKFEYHNHGKAKLVIGGPDSQNSSVEKWRRTLKEPSRVEVAGQIGPTNIPHVLRQADVVIIPSMEEGLPNLCLEAGASGCAVFGSNVGGLPEAVLHGQTGMLVKPRDIDGLSELLVEFADRRDTLLSMGERARQRMMMYFDESSFAPCLNDLYSEALGIT